MIAMDVQTREIAKPWEGEFHRPANEAAPETGVLVLSGSSGRIESERARLFAEQGMSALTIRWFAGRGRAGTDGAETPLEIFTEAIDLLRAEGAQRVGIVGVSKGAEAALLTAVRDPRVNAVVAISPAAHVWGWSTVGKPPRSSWTWRGIPLPFVPMDDAWASEHRHLAEPVAIRGWYEQSERRFSDHLATAAIPVERTRAEIVLVAGGDDAQWPSVPFAEQLLARRRTPGAVGSCGPIDLVTRPDAGHRPRFPGESPAQPPTVFAYGGTPEADARLGAEAWPTVLRALRGQAG